MKQQSDIGIEGAHSIDWKDVAQSIDLSIEDAKILWKYLAYGEVWPQADEQINADALGYESEPEKFYLHPNEAVFRLQRIVVIGKLKVVILCQKLHKLMIRTK